MPASPRHILVCRNDNIGDVVLTLPIITWLKSRFPQARISFMCRAAVAPVPRSFVGIDEVVEAEAVQDRAVSFFKTHGADCVIFAQPDSRLNRNLAMASFLARVPIRIGNARQKLYMALYCNSRVRFSKRTLQAHEAQFNFEFLRPFGLESIPDVGEIAAMYRWSLAVDAGIERMLKPYRFNLVIHPKSNGHGREWPAAYFSVLADLLAPHENVRLWMTGSAAEGKWLQENEPQLLLKRNVSNLCGQLSLAQLASLIQSADGLVASGTGPLHLSAALGQRTLGLFPPTKPMHPGRWSPVGPQASYLCRPTDCAGCARLETVSCACMENILPKLVAEKVLEWDAQSHLVSSENVACSH